MVQVACQMIIFGKQAEQDLPGVLKTVAQAGYAGIEGGISGGPLSAAEMRKLLDSMGLRLAGAHTGYDGLKDLDAMLDYMKVLDCKLLMCSGVGDHRRGLVAYDKAAKVFNDVGRRCQERGMRFCYHNHSWEFQTFDGVVALERLYEKTDPRYVHLCVDVYWVQHGGQSPVEFLKKYLNRIGTIHFKDMAKDGSFAEIGQGTLDFKGMMKVLAGKPDLDWIMVEQDTTKRTPAESVTLSRNYMRQELGI